MVSHNYSDDESAPPQSRPLLPDPPMQEHHVMVPVFLRVRLMAQCDVEAEVKAVEAARTIGTVGAPDGSWVASIHSIIAPICQPYGHCQNPHS